MRNSMEWCHYCKNGEFGLHRHLGSDGVFAAGSDIEKALRAATYLDVAELTLVGSDGVERTINIERLTPIRTS